MEKRGLLIVLLLLVVVFAFVKTDFKTRMQGYVVSEGDSIISDEVLEAVQQNGEARVMINLKSEVEDGKSIASENTKDEINDILDQEINEFDDKISAVVSADELEALKESGEVESVQIVKSRSISLQDSVPLVNIEDVWDIEIDGVNLNGEGEAICIIDTGVNYNHADLGGCYGDNDEDSECKVIGGWDLCADDVNCTTEDNDPLDNHGHGTHIAGIAAANGIAKGVAPGANLIIIKAANSSGTFWDDDLERAIDWCVGNATKFGITSISMSLGGGLYSDYCNDDPLNDSINAAVDAGIAVVVATGNDGSAAQIAAPSCMESVIPVGGSDKLDELYVSGNRNSLVKLLAPGVNINSTYKTGNNYVTSSGTSMSAPHIAGAFAIINQYKRLNELTALTPAELETLLYDTGKIISDFGDDFARIDVEAALLSADAEAPSVTLVSPENYKIDINQEQTFTCSASDLQLSGLTFQIWDVNNTLINETVFNVTSNTFEGEETLTLEDGKYYWNCLASDSVNNSGYADENNTLRIGNISVTLVSPEVHTNTIENEFACSVQNSVELTDITFNVWNSSEDLVNTETVNVTGTSNESTFTYNLTEEDSYEWNCLAVDEELNEISSDYDGVITYDATDPNVTITSPADDDSTTSTSVGFEYNVIDGNGIEKCDLIVDGSIKETETSVEMNITETITATFSAGTYDWKVSCTDLASNAADSEERTITIESVEEEDDDDDDDDDDDSDSGSSGSSGGSGGAAGANYFYILEEQLVEEIKRTMKSSDAMVFNVSDLEYVLRASSYTETEGTIKIFHEEDIMEVVINNLEKEKVNLDDDTTYDLEVSYEYVNTMAQIGIKKIDEEIPEREIVDEEDGTTVGTGQAIEGDFEMTKTTKIALGIVALIAALGAVGFYAYKNNDNILGCKIRNIVDKCKCKFK